MTLNHLIEKVKITRGNGYNCYRVKLYYKGDLYYCTSNNSLAWDRITESDFIPDRTVSNSYTLKGAYMAFFNECKRKNAIAEYRGIFGFIS